MNQVNGIKFTELNQNKMEKEMLKEFVEWVRNCGEDESYIFEETQEAIERFMFEKDLKTIKSE